MYEYGLAIFSINYCSFDLKVELLAFDVIFTISEISNNSSFNFSGLLESPVSAITSNQYSVSSASSTTIQILLKNSFFDLALEDAL